MNPGVYPGLPRSEYDKIDAINISILIEGRQTMAHLKYALGQKREETDAMRLGTAVHIAVFEPSEFEKRVWAWEETRRGKEYEAFKAAHSSCIILTGKQLAICIGIRDSVRSWGPSKEILESRGTGEITAVWRDEETGLLCKGMVDRFCEYHGYPAIIDLKTCADASEKAFQSTVGDMGYHIKAAWYLWGLNTIAPLERRFIWLAVEKEGAFTPALYEAEDDVLADGKRTFRRLLDAYAECLKSGVWPGYANGVIPLRLKPWSYGQ